MASSAERNFGAKTRQSSPGIRGDSEPGRASHPIGAVLGLLSRLRRTELFDSAFLKLFRTLQACGVDVLPNHYYWPIPDLRRLEQRPWVVRNQVFDLNIERQVRFASEVLPRLTAELRFPSAPGPDPTTYHRNNGMFESVDADVAYCMVRERKPRRIVEVGGGFSTRVIASAVFANEIKDDHRCVMTTVEPYPDRAMQQGLPGLTRLLKQGVQEAPIEIFLELQAGDILFIDSTHVVAVGSDVVYEFFEIFPRLAPGVIVHLHDIFYPSDYPRDAVLKFLWFWSEQYLLEALLRSSSEFEVLWSSSAMQLLYPQLLEQAFPAWKDSYLHMPRKARQFIPTSDGRRVWPSSFWMQKRHA